MRAPPISRTAWQTAATLVVAHLLCWAWIVRRGITYDWGGFEGLLWWLVAFLVLPAAAILVLIASWIKATKTPFDHSGD